MHFVYIIFSPSKNRYYVGQTKDLEKRISHHKVGSFKGSFTSGANDWELKLTLPFNDSKKALMAERFIKSMKSKTFILKLIGDPIWLIKKFS
jgi:putative endonuclease